MTTPGGGKRTWFASAGVHLSRVWAPVVVSAVLLLAGGPAAAQGADNVHFTLIPRVERISGSTVTVTWTTAKAKVGLVKWGKKKGQYGHTIREKAPTTDHRLTLTGLTQNTSYHYRVVTGAAKSPDHTFTTADYSDAPFTFANLGDNRGDRESDDIAHVTPSFQNILNAAVAKAPDFTVHVGDLFIGYTSQANTQQMYSVFKAAIQPLVNVATFTQYPFTISPGNHEMRPGCASSRPPSEAACAPAFDAYALFTQEMPNQPQNGPQGYLGTAFSFDYGNTHVASIDACHFDADATTEDFNLYDLNDAVIDWLDADLTAAQQRLVRHIFVMGHPEAWAPDGIRWSSGSSGSQADLYAVAGRLAAGAAGTILTSQDGITWTPQASGTTATLRALAYGPRIVAAGDSGTILTCELSGSTWTPRASGTTKGLYGLFSSGTLFVAVGSGGTILTSADGISWAAASSGTTEDLYSVTRGSTGGHQYFVAVGKGGTLITSHDANTWTAQAAGTTQDLLDVTGGVAYGRPLFSAVGSGGTILTSPDSVTWTLQTSGVSARLTAVICRHIFIALGEGGVVLTSEDGVAWAQQVSGTAANLYGIDDWDPDELLASNYFAVGSGGALLHCPEWLGVSSLGSYTSQRDRLWQVLSSHDVDAYLCGHVHTFDDSFTVDGVVQWLQGVSGCKGVGNGLWTLWSIEGDTATAQNLDEDGNATYTRVIQSSQP